MTSTELLKAGYGEIMRQDVPVPPVEDLVAQMQADRAASGDPVKKVHSFLFCFGLFWGFFDQSEGDRH